MNNSPAEFLEHLYIGNHHNIVGVYYSGRILVESTSRDNIDTRERDSNSILI